MVSFLGMNIKKLRIEKGLSQQQIANKLNVDRSTYSGWETGRRMPDTAMIFKISDLFNVDVSYLLQAAKDPTKRPNIIMVDDEKIVLTGEIPVIKNILPNLPIYGFTKPSAALEFAQNNIVSLAFLDIEMGQTSGIELCKKLLKINPKTNVIFLTAYAEYSFDAWSTGACGFILKPISENTLREQLSRLRYPFIGGEV